MTKALDYATRMAIATVVAEEMRGAAMTIQSVPAPQLHGPCSPAAEDFVIGAVLASPPPMLAARNVSIAKRRRAREREHSPSVDPRAFPLHSDHFWSSANQLYWLAMLDVPDPTDIPAIVDYLWNSGRITGTRESYIADLETLRANASAHAALYSVSSAVVLVLEHARARRLVGLLARLADGICAGSESHETAMVALREHFVAERGPVVKPV